MGRKVDINSLACDGCHMTVAELAEKYQVSERRIYQLRNAPEYKMAVKASSRQAYEGALVMAQIASVEAVKTLIDVMND